MTNQQSNKELVKAGHAFAAALSTDTPIIDMAKLFSELATRLDVLQARKKALAAENIQLRALLARVISQYGQAGYSSEKNSLNPAKALMYEAEDLLLSTPATYAILNAVRSDAISAQSDLMMWASLDEDIFANEPRGIAESLDLNPGDEFEVNVAARLPSRIYRMAESGVIELVCEISADTAKDDEQ